MNDYLKHELSTDDSPVPHRPIPVILDTDIGTDIDDTWALAQLLRSPELDTKLILTSHGDVTFRSILTAKFLSVGRRTDIPIGMGNPHGTTSEEYRNQGPWIRGYDIAQYEGEIVEDGIGRAIGIIEDSQEPVTLIAITPSENLAEILRRAPHIASRCRLVGMFGSFDVGYSGGPPASNETNVRMQPVALRSVLAAPWLDVLLTPLDTCNAAVLSGDHYHRIWSATDDPMLRAVIENYCVFAPRVNWMHCDFFALRSTILFDCVAVYLAYSEEFVETETIRFHITDDGFTVRDDAAGEFTARVALRWKNLDAFHEHLTERLLNKSGPTR